MSNLNRIILVGQIHDNPKGQTLAGGASVASMSLVVDRPARFNGKAESDIIPVVAFQSAADYIVQHCTQKDLVVVEGRIQVRTEDNAGKRNWITEVIAQKVNKFANSTEETKETNSASKETLDDVPF